MLVIEDGKQCFVVKHITYLAVKNSGTFHYVEVHYTGGEGKIICENEEKAQAVMKQIVIDAINKER